MAKEKRSPGRQRRSRQAVTTKPGRRGKPPRRFAPSIEKACAATGIGSGTLKRWVAIGAISRTPDGYDLDELVRVATERQAARDASGAGGVRMRAAGAAPKSESPNVVEQTRFRRLKNEKLELQLQRMRAELVPAKDVDAMLAERAASLARVLRSRARRINDQLEGKDAAGRLAVLDADAEQILAIYNEAPTWPAAAEAAEALEKDPELEASA